MLRALTHGSRFGFTATETGTYYIAVRDTYTYDNAGEGGYAMAKAAVMGMTRAAATDLGTYGIRVNAVNPGLVLSGMTLPRGQNRKGLVDASSMKRYALPEEIASVVMFLASDDSSFINGEFIAADGGATTYLHLATADAK